MNPPQVVRHHTRGLYPHQVLRAAIIVLQAPLDEIELALLSGEIFLAWQSFGPDFLQGVRRIQGLPPDGLPHLPGTVTEHDFPRIMCFVSCATAAERDRALEECSTHPEWEAWAAELGDLR